MIYTGIASCDPEQDLLCLRPGSPSPYWHPGVPRALVIACAENFASYGQAHRHLTGTREFHVPSVLNISGMLNIESCNSHDHERSSQFQASLSRGPRSCLSRTGASSRCRSDHRQGDVMATLVLLHATVGSVPHHASNREELEC